MRGFQESYRESLDQKGFTIRAIKCAFTEGFTLVIWDRSGHLHMNSVMESRITNVFEVSGVAEAVAK